MTERTKTRSMASLRVSGAADAAKPLLEQKEPEDVRTAITAAPVPPGVAGAARARAGAAAAAPADAADAPAAPALPLAPPAAALCEKEGELKDRMKVKVAKILKIRIS